MKAVVLLTSFVAMLNETAINIALSSLMDSFGVGVGTVQWLVTGFMLVMAAIVPVTAFILQRFKARSVYFASLILLIVGGVAAGLAPSFGVLLAARLVQAAGTCCVMTLTVNVVLSLTPPQSRGRAMGLVGLVTLFAPAIAPALSGLILQMAGWRWIFLGPLPLFVLLGAVSAAVLQNVIALDPRPLDALSVVLEAAGFAALLFGVSGLGDPGAGFPHLACGLGGLVLVTLFAVRQLRERRPLLDLGVFNWNFALAMVAVFFGIMTAFGMMVLLPMVYARAFGLAGAAAGLALLPGGMLNGLSAPIFGKLYDRAGPRALVIAGSALILACMSAFAFAPASLGLYVALHILCLLALSAVMTASQANAMRLSPEQTPHGTAIMSTLMQLGGGFGSALFSAIFAASARAAAAGGASDAAGAVAGFRGAFAIGACVFLLPLACSLFVHRAK